MEDVVSVRDVVAVLQRGEMVRRIAEELETYIIELGVDARLIRLQLDEILGDLEDDRWLVIQDYLFDPDIPVDDALEELASIDTDDLLDVREVARVLRLPGHMDLESNLQPRGYRLLAKVPRLPEGIIDHVVDRFGSLQKIMRATLHDLEDVQGVGEVRARAIKDGLSRLAESSILDRYS